MQTSADRIEPGEGPAKPRFLFDNRSVLESLAKSHEEL